MLHVSDPGERMIKMLLAFIIIAVVLVAQSCLTPCNPMDCSLPGSSVLGIFQARILEWVAISFSGDLPDPGIKPILQAYSLPSEPPDHGVLLNMDSPYTAILCKIFEEIFVSDYY